MSDDYQGQPASPIVQTIHGTPEAAGTLEDRTWINDLIAEWRAEGRSEERIAILVAANDDATVRWDAIGRHCDACDRNEPYHVYQHVAQCPDCTFPIECCQCYLDGVRWTMHPVPPPTPDAVRRHNEAYKRDRESEG